jgi:hypothetical protein
MSLCSTTPCPLENPWLYLGLTLPWKYRPTTTFATGQLTSELLLSCLPAWILLVHGLWCLQRYYAFIALTAPTSFEGRYARWWVDTCTKYENHASPHVPSTSPVAHGDCRSPQWESAGWFKCQAHARSCAIKALTRGAPDSISEARSSLREASLVTPSSHREFMREGGWDRALCYTTKRLGEDR